MCWNEVNMPTTRGSAKPDVAAAQSKPLLHGASVFD